MEKAKKIEAKSALLIVDVQNDFCPGGALPVPDGNKVVARSNRLIRKFFENGLPIFASRDFHPKNTTHFYTHGGNWPPHCIRGTEGVKFHKNLLLPFSSIIVSKGTGIDENAYSAFEGLAKMADFDPMTGWDGSISFTLEELLRLFEIDTVYVCGLATDYCVKATVLDALKLGFKVYLLKDACRAVNIKPGDGDRAIKEMKKASKGKFVLTSVKEVLGK